MKCIGNFIIFLSMFMTFHAHAQVGLNYNMEDHDAKPYYFGLAFGVNTAAYRISHNQYFATNDTFTNIQAKWSPGFNIGLIGTLRLNKLMDLRFIPTISFTNKPFLVQGINYNETKNMEAIYMHLPLQIKWKSDRIGNFRFYALTGGKFDYDLAANARSRRTDEFLKVKPFDLGAEVGVGFDFFFPNFILTPEIKLSQGFMNSHFPDNDLPISRTIDRLTTRMIVFSLLIQG